MQITAANTQAAWVTYQPARERDKKFYDIKLRDGTIVHACYPNANTWYQMGGEMVITGGANRKATTRTYADYRVVAIRLCNYQPLEDDGGSSQALQMDKEAYCKDHERQTTLSQSQVREDQAQH